MEPFIPCRIYVGNFSFQLDQKHLVAMFSEQGTIVQSQLLPDRSGRPERLHSGRGFITYTTQEEADAAIEAWHDKPDRYHGRRLIVRRARPERKFAT